MICMRFVSTQFWRDYFFSFIYFQESASSCSNKELHEDIKSILRRSIQDFYATVGVMHRATFTLQKEIRIERIWWVPASRLSAFIPPPPRASCETSYSRSRTLVESQVSAVRSWVFTWPCPLVASLLIQFKIDFNSSRKYAGLPRSRHRIGSRVYYKMYNLLLRWKMFFLSISLCFPYMFIHTWTTHSNSYAFVLPRISK